MKRVFLLALILAIFTASCNKDDSETEVIPIPEADYMQLKVGNYWAYEGYRLDSTGNETPITALTDSLVIIGDTNIRGELYFKQLSTTSLHIAYLRDSSGYLVNGDGEFKFCDHNFNEIFRVDTIHPDLSYIEYMMLDHDSLISVPFGTYSTLEVNGKVIPLDPNYPHGINYTHYFYADGIGMIKSSTYYFSSPQTRIGKRLTNFGNIAE